MQSATMTIRSRIVRPAESSPWQAASRAFFLFSLSSVLSEEVHPARLRENGNPSPYGTSHGYATAYHHLGTTDENGLFFYPRRRCAQKREKTER